MKNITHLTKLFLLINLLCLSGMTFTATGDTPPEFTSCPSTITVALCQATIDYAAVATADPAPVYSYTFSGVTIEADTGTGSGSTFNQGVTTVTIVASNTAGSDTCTFDVNVVSIPPTFTSCPENITVYGNPLTCGAVVDFTAPVANVPCINEGPDAVPDFTFFGEFQGHKYFISNVPQYWSSVQNLASLNGTNLLSINSAEENYFLFSNIAAFGGNAFTGMSDESSEGDWKWLDGSPVTYTNWEDGEPNNWDNNEHYGQFLINGKWNDCNANTACNVILEYKSSEITTVSGLPSGSLFPLGTTINSYEITDAYGQSATCSFTVTILDTVPPTIVCPGDQTIHCQSQEFLKPLGVDNCVRTGNSYTYEYTTDEPFNMYTYVPNSYYSNDGSFHVSLPFNFKYFGIEYHDINLACNGFITFNGLPGVGDGCCNGLPLPEYNFEKSIAVNWSDLEGVIYTKTFGSEPNRVFVISWRGYEAYHDSNSYDVQLALYEGTNVIKIINVYNDGFTGHTKTMGLSNTGIEAVVFDERNGSNWSASNECITFTPSSPVIQIAGPSPGFFPLGTSLVTYAVTDNSGNTETCSFNITYEPYLSDTVTVGVGGTYPNLTGAGGLFDAINTTGICGQFWARVISDLQEPGTISLNKISYGDPLNDYLALYNESDGTFYIYGNVPQALIRFNGADNIKVLADYSRGNLYFENLNASYPVLELTNGASGNFFNGCIFAGSNTNTESGVVVLGGTNINEGNSYNKFFTCTFRNSIASSTYPANLFYSSGNALYPNNENYIGDNHFLNFDQKGIYVTSTGNGDYWEIDNNSFYFSNSLVTKANKVFINFVPGIFSYGHSISYNCIGGTGSSAYGSPLQISGAGTIKGIVYNGEYMFVYGNIIRNIGLTSTGITNFTGFECTGGISDVANNEFGGNNIRRITVAGTGTIIGILSSSPDFIYAYDNHIHGTVFTKSSGSPVFKGLQINSGYAFNNIIYDITTTMPNLSPTFYGICNIASALTGHNLVFNNMISLNSGASLKPKVYGIFDQSVGFGGEFFNNTVYISGKTTNGYFTSAFYRIGNASTMLYNNILVNTRIANVYAKHYAIHTNSQLNWMSNHNVLNTTSGCLGNWGGATYANMTVWRLMTGQDINSIYFLPDFYSTIDLHLAGWSTANDTLSYVGGSYTQYAPFDLDWDNRGYPPTPGADEWYYQGSAPRLEAEADFSTDNESNNLIVYPNPVTSTTTIVINLTQDNNIMVEMYNTIGVKILVIAEGSFAAGTHTFNVNANNLPAGAYLCRYIINGSESIIKRVEIIR